MPDAETTVYFNPRCSKCRSARALLEERGTQASYVHYLDDKPTRPELERLMRQLGISSPREMMRTGEAIYAELGLADAGDARLLEAIVAHPILLERPIVVRGERAVIARPPERLQALWSE